MSDQCILSRSEMYHRSSAANRSLLWVQGQDNALDVLYLASSSCT